MDQRCKPPLLPEGTEIVVGLGLAVLAAWQSYFTAHYPIWLVLVLTVAAYLFGYFPWNLWTYRDRMCAKSIKMLNGEIRPQMEVIRLGLPRVRKSSAQDDIVAGYQAASDAIDEMWKLDSGTMFLGLQEVNFRTKDLAKTLSEYLDIQDHPAKAGEKRAALMAEWENQGFVGFRSWAESLSERINKGEIFDATTSARVLGAFRKLLPQNLTSPNDK